MCQYSNPFPAALVSVRRSRRIASAAAALVLLCGAAANAQNGTVLTFTRGAGSDNYGDALNWSGGPAGAVPVNAGLNLFSAVIGDGRTVQLDAATPSVLELQDFTLGNSTFIVGLNRTFRVLDDATINGWVRVDGPSVFQATGTSCTLNPYSRFTATAGGRIDLGATTWNTYVYAYSDLSQSLATASGVGSQFNANSVTTLTFGGSSFNRDFFDLTATQGGSISMSGLQTIQNAPGEDDYLSININNGGTMNLSSLNAINMIGGNDNTTVEFNLGTGSSLSLGALVDADRIRLNLSTGATFNAPNLTRLSKSVLNIQGGRTVTTGTLSNLDNTIITVADGQSYGSVAPNTDVASVYYFGGNYDLYSATGAGSTLNLAGIRSLVIGTNSGQNQVSIAARAGGSLNLSGLRTVGVYSGQDETINFEVTGAGSTLNLSGLTTITANGNTNDRVRFTVGPGLALNLPSLTTAGRVEFAMGTGATLSAPNLTTLTQTTLSVDGTSPLTFGSVTEFDSTRLLATGGAVVSGFADTDYVMAYYFSGNFTMLSATGAGTQLNLPGVARIRYATNTGPNLITIAAIDGGAINLSGVTNVSNFNGDDDTLNFEVRGAGSSLNLSGLTTITNNNNGATRFTVGGGSSVALPALTSANNLQLVLEPGASFSAPALATLNNSTLSLAPGYTLNLGPLSNVNGTRFLVSGGRTFSGVSATAYTSNYIYNFNHDMFAATGAGSVLNLPTIQTLQFCASGQYLVRVAARDGGSVNLSGLTSVNVYPGEDDYLQFEVTGSGSSMNLTGLTTAVMTGNTNDRVRFTADSGYTFNLPSLTAGSRMLFDLTGGASFSAPNLTSLTETLLLPSPTWAVSTAPLTNIDRDAIRVTGGVNYNNVIATSYSYQSSANFYGHDFDLFTATGAGSVLNLSTLQTMTYSSNYGRVFKTIAARSGGVVNLSGLTTINTQNGEDDVLRFNTDSGTINLNSLANINIASGSDNARVQFNVGVGQSQSLPALASASRTDFNLADGATLSAPVLASINNGSVTLAAGRTLSLPALTSVNRFSFNLGDASTLSMPALASVTESTWNIAPGRTLGTGTITNIDNSRFLVSGGAVFGGTLADASYSIVYFYNSANYDILAATGAGSQLNASGIQNITYGISGYNTYTIAARDGGSVNLSSLRTVSVQPGEDDTLNFEVTGAGSTMNLSNLRTTSMSGNRNDRILFTVGSGNTISLPALTTAQRLSWNVAPGGTLNAPALTTLQQSNLQFTNTGGTVNIGTLSNIDQSIIGVSNGVTFSNISAVDVSNQYYWRGSFNQYTADGAGSVLTMNSIRSLRFATDSGRDTIGIRATNGGQINMTGLRDINIMPNEDDELAFSARDPGSVVRLGPLTTLNASNPYNRNPAISFTASLGGRIEFGDLTLPTQTAATIADVDSTMSVTRSVQFRGGILSVAAGATLEVGKHMYNYATNESGWIMQQGILSFSAPGLHFFEAAGIDIGPMNPGNNGNFGVGRVVLGSAAGAGQLQMLDLVDNGNRGANLGEAFYIFGVGQGTALESLQLINGSTLFLDNINVYVRENGNWIWLNSLFAANQSVVPWGGGYLHLPSPGAAALLGLGALAAARRRR
jgi:hypothetical protein